MVRSLYKVAAGAVLTSIALTTAPASAENIVLKPHAVQDASAKVTALHVWAPADWQVTGGVSYNPVPSMAMTVAFGARRPDATLGVERVHGEARAVWATGPLGGFPEGQLYFGNPVERTKDAATVVKAKLVPFLRQQHPDYEIVEITHQPKWVEALNKAQKLSPMNTVIAQNGGRVDFDAVTVRAKYTVKGKPVDEVIHLAMQYQLAAMGNMSATTWGIHTADRLFAPKGELDEHEAMLRSIARSMRIDAKWWVGMQATRHRVWQTAGDAQRDWDSYIKYQNDLMKRRDNIYQGFAHYIRGTGIYRNPADNTLWELPDQKKYIWFGPDREVLTSDSPNYNPNTDPQRGGTWHAAK